MATVFLYFAEQKTTDEKEQCKTDVECTVTVPYLQKHVLYHNQCLRDTLFNYHISHDLTPFLTHRAGSFSLERFSPCLYRVFAFEDNTNRVQ